MVNPKIFEGATFGDKFLTASGKECVYMGSRRSYFPREKRYVNVLLFADSDCIEYDEYDHFVGIRYNHSYDERFPDECDIVSKCTISLPMIAAANIEAAAVSMGADADSFASGCIFMYETIKNANTNV